MFASGGHYDHHGPTEHAHLVPIHKTSKEKLRRGIDIFHCHSPMKSCDLLLATNCTIDPVTTVYDNNGWKLLWKFARDFDWKVSDTGLSIQIKVRALLKLNLSITPVRFLATVMQFVLSINLMLHGGGFLAPSGFSSATPRVISRGC